MNKDCYIYGNGMQERAISWVDDYNPTICRSLFNTKTYNQTINIGGDVFLSINDWYKMVQVATGWDRPAIHIDARPGEVRNAYCSHEKAKLLTGFENKINPFHALNEMWNYFQSKGPREFKYLNDFELYSPLIPKTWKEKIF
jgi:UDP-glucose 4-epimerase